MYFFIDKNQMKGKVRSNMLFFLLYSAQGQPRGGSIVSVDPLLFFQNK